MAIDVEKIIAQFYEPGSELWDILLTHSRSVADLAVSICQAHPELGADEQFVREAAMLHDIGIIRTSAESIHCMGDQPYICHGVEGRAMLDSLGLSRHALVCERHTGAGLSAEHIAEAGLPLPVRDMTPQSIEEKIVCFADKFYSKSKNLTERKSMERALKSVSKFGDDSRDRFLAMDALFHIPELDN